MTTAAQLLVALSGLSSGTAAEHLLAIQTGAGSGETIFASRFSVQIETPEVTVLRKASRLKPASVPARVPAPAASAIDRQAYVVTVPDRIEVRAQADEMTVFSRTNTRTVATTFDRLSVTRKPGRS